MNISIPQKAEYIINSLENSGFEAYVVGGCVRDALRGVPPKDWDICTSALPEQIRACFPDTPVIDTGIKHGTVTVLIDKEPFEVTTYRVDGKYKDNRRPETVKFVNVLKRDLARRDFTINAMAYNPKTGIVDYYGGETDLTEHRIKCVGNPNKRFSEDALRIMRAMRFASILGFTIEKNTAVAMRENKKLLQNIASERIAIELNNMLIGDRIREVICEHIDVIIEIIPEMGESVGFNQRTPYHCYDVLEHTLHAIEAAPRDVILRLAVFFHDIGKPQTYSQSEDGRGHFYGHDKVSCDMARIILNRLKYDNDTIRAVTELIMYHGSEIDNKKHVKRLLGKLGEERVRQLFEVKKADTSAQAEEYRNVKFDVIEKAIGFTNEIIEENRCFSLKDLAVNGNDLIAIGITGTKIGETLKLLLNMVIEDEIENDKDKLLDYVRIGG